MEIAQNEMTLLTCMISYGHPQPTIKWYKNGQPLVEIPGRVHIVDNGQSVVSRISIFSISIHEKLFYFEPPPLQDIKTFRSAGQLVDLVSIGADKGT